ncbi:AraC family transcriptional regulator [uncultured Desulfovibrio sp.]|uniref:AraC family transcriptional regulator n=1 Tax=uncultured Desulfovibrio sp. TaxID=167968 RepID=UPI00260368A5|nr:AraC family transcriptional regulator [uncultured Desulfovibrio sp.]
MVSVYIVSGKKAKRAACRALRRGAEKHTLADGRHSMTDDRQARITEANARLKEILLRHVPRPAVLPGPVDGVFLVRREAVNCSESCFTRPLASLIVQGGKRAVLGSREYTIRADQCLVAAVDMPSLSHAVDPTPERPFLSLFFHLDRQMLGELLMEMTPEERAAGVDDSGVSVADADPDLMEGVLRLAELLDKPRQIAVRAPLIMRELHYLLLAGPQGGILRGLYAHGARNGQILQAIALMRRNMTRPLRMDALARQVCMSVSSLHRHFKSITGLSPLQYHKQLRLYEAQRLMLVENERAASAALSVGYESVTQFTREYKRMFGESPHRDISRRRCPA